MAGASEPFSYAKQLGGETFTSGATTKRERPRPTATYLEPARELPVYRETDVLVVGGGPAGTAAAIAAARLGADVTLVERYSHLGGMSTGGLVIWIDRMSDWSGRQVISGIASDLLDRLPPDGLMGPHREQWGSQDTALATYWTERTCAFRGTVTWSPTIDPEWLKVVSLQLVLEAGVKLMLHSWVAAPIVEGNQLRGALFEGKEGRQAILAKIVVDASGDGDLYAWAGAPFESDIDESDIHHCMNVAFMWAGVDMERWYAFKQQEPQAHAEFVRRGRELLGFLDRPYASWRSDVALWMGPRMSGYSPLNVEDLTTVEVESRKRMIEHLDYYRRNAPGFERAWVMLTAPQMGSRHSRRLGGARRMRNEEWKAGHQHDDEIGISPAPSPAFPNVSIPYGSLVPAQLDGILAAGRHLSCDPQTHTFMREIPQCWVTGQAAGVAAALAADRGVQPREVDVPTLQRELARQGVVLTQPAAAR